MVAIGSSMVVADKLAAIILMGLGLISEKSPGGSREHDVCFWCVWRRGIESWLFMLTIPIYYFRDNCYFYLWNCYGKSIPIKIMSSRDFFKIYSWTAERPVWCLLLVRFGKCASKQVVDWCGDELSRIGKFRGKSLLHQLTKTIVQCSNIGILRLNWIANSTEEHKKKIPQLYLNLMKMAMQQCREK